MVLCAMFAALTAVCAWISIPVPPVAVTMQTFALFLTLGILGGKWGTVSILLYLLLGTVGLPVFSGFRSGAAALLDTTGGFLWGFLAMGLVCWGLERLGRLPAMVLSLPVCYLCGAGWFCVYTGADIRSGLTLCVLPFLLPDLLKLALAWSLSKRIARQLRL
jgi:biotin transport system substrate-specific component